jgi:hypothetical protein
LVGPLCLSKASARRVESKSRCLLEFPALLRNHCVVYRIHPPIFLSTGPVHYYYSTCILLTHKSTSEKTIKLYSGQRLHGSKRLQKEGLQLVCKEGSKASTQSVVRFQNLNDFLDRVGFYETLHIGSSLLHNDLPCPVRHFHQLGLQRLPIYGYSRPFVVQHAPRCFVEGLNLMRFQVAND